MAIHVRTAGKKDVSAIERIFRNQTDEFRKRNIDTNLLDIGWGPERLAAQRNAGGIFVAKDSGSLVGFGMPVTYKIQSMDASVRYRQASFAGNAYFYHGEEAARASYRRCYETADFVLFLPHEAKDAGRIYLPLLARIVEEARKMPGIRKLCGALPEMYGKIATELGMATGGYKGIYEITFEGKKIKPAKIDLHPSSKEFDPEDIGPNEDGRYPRKKERNFC